MKKVVSTFLVLLMLSMSICMPVQAQAWGSYSITYFPDLSYKIPDLNTTFVPQGLCKTTYNKKTYRLITAYDHVDSNEDDSRIYIMDSNGKHLKTVDIENSGGEHVGGITEYKGQIFITSTDKIFVIKKKDLFKNISNKSKNSEVKPFKILEHEDIITDKKSLTEGNFSFCTTNYNGNLLWIGTYVSSFKWKDRKKNPRANAYTYKDGKLVHYASMDIPRDAQGMCFGAKGKVYISRTPLAPNGYIEEYKITNYKNKIKKTNILLYEIKYKSEINTPGMIEGIYLTKNENIYAIFESGSKVYKYKPVYKENRVLLIDL